MVNVKSIGKNWNAFQKLNSGKYSLKNYPGNTLKEINKIKVNDYLKWRETEIEIKPGDVAPSPDLKPKKDENKGG